MPKTVAEVVKMGEEVQIVDLRFTDLLGTWHHFSLPARELSEELFSEGIGFDGSSIRGFQEIHESDMILMLDPETAFVDQIFEVPTLVIICAPARLKSASEIAEPSPAPASMRTSWPRWTSSATPAGVIATRYSLFLISVGMPTRMIAPIVDFVP